MWTEVLFWLPGGAVFPNGSPDGSRRKVICIPRDFSNQRRRQRPVSSHSFHGYSKNIMPAKSGRSVPRVQQARVANDHVVIHIDDIESIVLFDLLRGYRLFGVKLFRPANGMTPGSPLSLGMCP
eukprot:4053808-Pyramimonas_sp.AAC.1